MSPLMFPPWQAKGLRMKQARTLDCAHARMGTFSPKLRLSMTRKRTMVEVLPAGAGGE